MSLETSLLAMTAAYWRAMATAAHICATADVPTIYHSRIDGCLLPW